MITIDSFVVCSGDRNEETIEVGGIGREFEERSK